MLNPLLFFHVETIEIKKKKNHLYCIGVYGMDYAAICLIVQWNLPQQHQHVRTHLLPCVTEELYVD